MAILDPHSFADDTQPTTKHICLTLVVDFSERTLTGTATLELDRPAEGVLDLDARNLTVEAIKDGDGNPVEWDVSHTDDVLGTRLRLTLKGQKATIRYRTNEATALQWLDPAQTAGKVQPYVFTQCQPIHARSLFPCQDTPRARITYDCTLTIPSRARAVMAAAHVERTEDGELAHERFEMAQPIPTYLFAFAVGNIAAKDLGPRSRVFAEPSMLEAAAYEFAGVEAMITKAESLFGPYDWDRFDLLVMPPSFPYGGMENPRLTFLTPTVIAGDRSLVNIVAHELAHSWTGNLVTNASMNDFWLNEGFTTYAERRILEAIEGPESVALHCALGVEGLRAEVNRFGPDSPFTRLRTELDGVDPDSVYSRVPYEKGFLFLYRIEEIIGREAFDKFLIEYIKRFRFQSITTEMFLTFLGETLEGLDEKVDLDVWIRQSGLPRDTPSFVSNRLKSVVATAVAHQQGIPLTPEAVQSWSAQEWQIFFGALPTTIEIAECKALDKEFGLSTSSNAEIRVAFLTLAAGSGHVDILDRVEEALLEIGRMKYLRPLYTALLTGGFGERARSIFESAKDRYHPVAAAMVEGVLQESQS